MPGARLRREAVERFVDLTVFAPIGLLSLARDHRPELRDVGRGDVGARLAQLRRVGRLAVTQGRAEVQRRVDGDRAAATSTAVVTEDEPPAPAATAAPPRRELPDAAELPIEGYDHLAASQIVAALATLDDDELDVIEAFELANRNRRTIHGRIAQLRASR